MNEPVPLFNAYLQTRVAANLLKQDESNPANMPGDWVGANPMQTNSFVAFNLILTEASEFERAREYFHTHLRPECLLAVFDYDKVSVSVRFDDGDENCSNPAAYIGQFDVSDDGNSGIRQMFRLQEVIQHRGYAFVQITLRHGTFDESLGVALIPPAYIHIVGRDWMADWTVWCRRN